MAVTLAQGRRYRVGMLSTFEPLWRAAEGVVHMNGAGPRHTHHEGEVNWCIALSGEPRFDGHGPGWVAFPPGSTHVPTVEGGEMLIVYLLPNGAVEFHA
jgi:hypothetical protein